MLEATACCCDNHGCVVPGNETLPICGRDVGVGSWVDGDDDGTAHGRPPGSEIDEEVGLDARVAAGELPTTAVVLELGVVVLVMRSESAARRARSSET